MLEIKFFLNELLDYFFYRKCYFCPGKAELGLMCKNCFEKIISKGFKKIKKINGVNIQGYFYYSDEIKKLIRAVKYHNKRKLASDIAKILANMIKNTGKGEYELIPVPLHDKRYKQRKYNHMELISDELSKLTGYKVNTDLIQRVKNTKPQYKLTQKERRTNLQDAFTVNLKAYSGKKIVLFDDITTSGVTMEELIKKLKESNIHDISGLVIAFSEKSKF